ncbi:hypothetical protein HDC34_001920 [Pseudoclavibacter sp. JAI123]|uniref:hypothetical protein n=1 Tax=Pseudoclavibacter sp. JAI123 TaxID=2723065 RepID=UPI0015C7032D|nr:hypothetical protein [Pseudoclavibacter sp. JAI123]NYF13626.1 hypothetical protein [Pseudoclavibacter sp. JAI123]
MEIIEAWTQGVTAVAALAAAGISVWALVATKGVPEKVQLLQGEQSREAWLREQRKLAYSAYLEQAHISIGKFAHFSILRRTDPAALRDAITEQVEKLMARNARVDIYAPTVTQTACYAASNEIVTTFNDILFAEKADDIPGINEEHEAKRLLDIITILFRQEMEVDTSPEDVAYAEAKRELFKSEDFRPRSPKNFEVPIRFDAPKHAAPETTGSEK